MFNLELPWHVAKGAVSTATYRKQNMGLGGMVAVDLSDRSELKQPASGDAPAASRPPPRARSGDLNEGPWIDRILPRIDDFPLSMCPPGTPV